MADAGLDKVKTVLRVTSGNFLEMYDFFLFGIFAKEISETFFPSDDPYASLMATFLSFAAGFAMRPIGALVLGPYRYRTWPPPASSSPRDQHSRHDPHRLRAGLCGPSAAIRN